MLSIESLRQLGSAQIMEQIRELSNVDAIALARVLDTCYTTGSPGGERLARCVAVVLAERLEVADA